MCIKIGGDQIDEWLRINTALRHAQPDRTPADLGGHFSSGMMAKAYIELRRALGLPPSRLYIYDFVQQLALVEADIFDRIGGDVKVAIATGSA